MPVKTDTTLHDPPSPEGLESLKTAIAHRLSSSFAYFGRPAPGTARTMFDSLVKEAFGSNPETSEIPTLSDSMVESLTNSALMEAGG